MLAALTFIRRRRTRLNPTAISFAGAMMLLAILFSATFAEGAVALNAQEQKMAELLVNSSGQRRDRGAMVPDERLCQVARSRAMDMAKRRYFAHVNPDGKGPNYLVRAAGYPLPSHYSTSASANNIESIGCGYADANAAWSGWMGSAGHKTHLLATESFYRDQTAFGVGYYADPNSPYVRYYVVLTAPPAADLLTITSPSSGARVTTPEVTVTGQVSGGGAVAQLQYRLENAAGIGGWMSGPVPSGSGVSTWSAKVNGLRLGTNTIRVRSVNASGTALKETARTVRLAVLRPLVVEASEGGTVTAGFLGTTQREVGLRYSIAGVPKVGFIFDRWEGLPDETADPLRARQSFVMEEGLTLRASFIPNPFPPHLGTYQGLILGDGTFGSTGVLRLALAANGGFSGQLILGPKRFTVRGTLNSAGSATVSFKRPDQSDLVLHLALDIANPANGLSARVLDGTTEWTVQTARREAPLPTGSPARKFTFHVAPDGTVPESPQGHGIGVATVSAANMIVFSGTMADGRPFAATAALGTNGAVAFHAPILGNTGALAGVVQLSSEDLSGSLRWFKPARPRDVRYAAAFTSAHAIVGNAYVTPAAAMPAIELPSGGLLEFSGGDLDAAMAQPIVTVNAGFGWSVPVVNALRINVRTVTGYFAGSFQHPTGGTRIFRAVLLQGQRFGFGYSMGPTVNGAVTLTPASE